MGEARDVMDRATAAIFSNDMAAIAECYAADVVAQTPDAGTINGRDDLVDYMRQMSDAFPDLSYEMTRTMEDGKFAIDEGTVIGTNTGPLALATGEVLPPTGKPVRLRSIDVATVEGGSSPVMTSTSTRWRSSSSSDLCSRELTRNPTRPVTMWDARPV